MREREDYWNQIHETKHATEVSWFQPHAVDSLALVTRAGVGPDDAIVDIGAGASLFTDQLRERGFADLTVLDVSQRALDILKQRHTTKHVGASYVAADVASWRPTTTYALWHDRAVFHFLTEAHDRAGYRAALDAALRPKGFAIVATFAPDGPQQCSGLPVRRYDEQGLAQELGPTLSIVESRRVVHLTPTGKQQQFVFLLLQKK